jgi:hypothetical protein
MKVLVACEESQTITIAFRNLGHEAYSCDINPCSGGHPEWHLQQDVVPLLTPEWDLMIAHPPCTYLSYVGTRHWNKPGRAELREKAMQFFMLFINEPIKRICVENPLGYPTKVYRKPDQTIHPYYFGDKDQKRTCLWIKNLPKLYWVWKDDMFYKQTAVEKPEPYCFLKTTGKPIYWTEYKHGSIVRSKTFPSIANAMAQQWGNLE